MSFHIPIIPGERNHVNIFAELCHDRIDIVLKYAKRRRQNASACRCASHCQLRHVQNLHPMSSRNPAVSFLFLCVFVRRDRLCGKVGIMRGFLRKRWGMVEKEI